MRRVYVNNAKLSSSQKSINFECDGKNWSIDLEVLLPHGIKEPKELEKAIIELDPEKEVQPGIGQFKNWIRLKKYNILRIVNETDLDYFSVKNIQPDENENATDVFSDEYQDENDDESIILNDLSGIYEGVEFYQIHADTKKMDQIEKVIEKAIKITKTKVNYGVVKTDDFTFKQMLDLAKDELVPFITGKTSVLVIERPKAISIPSIYKDDKEGVVEYLKKKYGEYTTASDFKDFERSFITITKLVEKIEARRNGKFASLNKLAKKADKYQYEMGFNPLAVAWPWVTGKTEKGTFFHAPVAYQYIKIEESLDAYRITKEENFNINVYPIIKNYVENKNTVNVIKPIHKDLKNVLIEFYKHGIKILSPKDNSMKNYDQISEYSDKANNLSNGVFELSQEVLFTIKSKDEPIYTDLKRIRADFDTFNVPESNSSIYTAEEETPEKHFILDLDDSKSYAVDEAIKESAVIKGPPGTGKSETITAIVGQIIKNYKTSLLVAEKSTAIEVIEKNLRKNNLELDSFVVNLNHTSKDLFTEKFNKQIKILTDKKYFDKPKDVSSINPSKKWVEDNREIVELFGEINVLEKQNPDQKIFDTYSKWVKLYEAIFNSDRPNFKELIKWLEKCYSNEELRNNLDSLKEEVNSYESKIESLTDVKNDLEDEINSIITEKVSEMTRRLSDFERQKEELLEIEEAFPNKIRDLKINSVASIRKNQLTQSMITAKEFDSLVNAKTYESMIAILQPKKPILIKTFIKKNLENIKAVEEVINNFKDANAELIKLIQVNEKQKTDIDLEISSLNLKINSDDLSTLDEICNDGKYISLKSKLPSIQEEILDQEKNVAKLISEIKKYDEKMAMKFDEVVDLIPETIPSNALFSLFDKIFDLKSELGEREEKWVEHKNDVKKHIKKIREWTVHNYVYEFNKQYNSDLEFKTKVERVAKIVKVQLQLKKNTIIDLFTSFHAVLKKIFPCIMCSPDIVSTILPTDINQFDYGIFDEASQIWLHKAIPTIHRCKIIIVSGDEKQLGPADLFADITNDEDGAITSEENEDDDFAHATLLDFATNKYKRVLLNTHYRSRSKQLIEFSNKHFYDNKIHITDSPESKFDGHDGIVVEEINGIWTEERTNEEEVARAIALSKMYLEQGLSLGVITFNDNQATKIANGIKDVVDNAKLGLDNFFVKPIREVQGDERDVIIFSITYGKRSASDTYVTSFGQFSKEKINVAITRAKKRMHVLKSLPSSKVLSNDDDKRVFREWLLYLENISKSVVDIDNHENVANSVFEVDYMNSLKTFMPEHWVALANYPVGPKFIDIVIFDKIKNKFIVAIELDGAKWHASIEQQINDYNRQIFLENMGWEFIRVTPLQFYSNRDKRVKDDIQRIFDISQHG